MKKSLKVTLKMEKMAGHLLNVLNLINIYNFMVPSFPAFLNNNCLIVAPSTWLEIELNGLFKTKNQGFKPLTRRYKKLLMGILIALQISQAIST